MLPVSAYPGDRTPSHWETSMLPVSALRSLNLRVFDPRDRLTLVSIESLSIWGLPVSAHPRDGLNTGQHWESLNATRVSPSRASNTLRLRDLNDTCVSPSRGSNTLRSERPRCYPCQPITGLEHWSALRVSQCYQGQPIPGIEHPQIERPQCYLCSIEVSQSEGVRSPGWAENWSALRVSQCYQGQPRSRGSNWPLAALRVSQSEGYQCQPIPGIGWTLVSIDSLSMLPGLVLSRG